MKKLTTVFCLFFAFVVLTLVGCQKMAALGNRLPIVGNSNKPPKPSATGIFFRIGDGACISATAEVINETYGTTVTTATVASGQSAFIELIPGRYHVDGECDNGTSIYAGSSAPFDLALNQRLAVEIVLTYFGPSTGDDDDDTTTTGIDVTFVIDVADWTDLWRFDYLATDQPAPVMSVVTDPIQGAMIKVAGLYNNSGNEWREQLVYTEPVTATVGVGRKLTGSVISSINGGSIFVEIKIGTELQFWQEYTANTGLTPFTANWTPLSSGNATIKIMMGGVPQATDLSFDDLVESAQ